MGKWILLLVYWICSSEPNSLTARRVSSLRDKDWFPPCLFLAALRMLFFSIRFGSPEMNFIPCMVSSWTRMLEPRLSKRASQYWWLFALWLFSKG